MTAERWRRMKELFEEALDRPDDERAGFVEIACGGDRELESELARLLEQSSKSGFLDATATAPFIALRILDTATATFQPGDRVAGRFDIYRFIARGGMGEVYEAFDTELGERVALKAIRRDIASNPRAVRLFKDEVRRARSVICPYVCRVYDLFTDRLPDGNEVVFLTMQLLEGETLSARLARDGALPAEQAMPILRHLSEALTAIHQAGMIHRDVKSGNVMLVSHKGTLRAVATDFGLAHPVVRGAAEPGREAELAGTPNYMSPEQRAGGDLTPQSDLYSLAVVAWETLSGKVPFPNGNRSGDTTLSLRQSAPTVPRRFEKAIRRCLRIDPAARLRTAREFQRALEPRRYSRLLGLPMLAAAVLLVLFQQYRSWSPKPNSLAVLPLTAAGSSAEPEYYRDGITEEIIRSLARIPALRVVARESSFRFRSTSEPADEVGRRLGVAAVLTGTVERRDRRLRLVLQLVASDGAYVLWSEAFERPEEELAGVQADIGASIASALNVRLTPTRQAEPQRSPPEARELYFLGRFHWNKRGDQDLARAKEYFEQAIARQPNYALALVGLADTYAVMAERHSLPPDQALASAKDAALRAIALDPLLADGYASLGLVASLYDRDFRSAEQHFRRALDLDPQLVTANQWFSYTLLKLRRFDEAEQYARRALERDPVALPANNNLAAVLHYRGRLDAAIRQCRRLLELDPQHAFAGLFIAQDYARLGRRDEALRELAAFRSLPADHPLRLRLSVEALALLGDRRAAEEKLRSLIERRRAGDVPASYVAFACASLNRTDEAFEWLERAYQERDGMINLLHAYPACSSLRSDARYKPLLARLGITEKTE